MTYPSRVCRRAESAVISLLEYGIEEPATVQFSKPRPVSAGRTFASSNFLVAIRSFKRRLKKLNPASAAAKVSTDRFPADYLFKAVEELIHFHLGTSTPKAKWMPAFHKVCDQIRKIPPDHYNRSDASETAQFLWSSAKAVGDTELCSILNAVIRDDDPATIMHAAVLSCGVNRALVGDRESVARWFTGRLKKTEYPQKLEKGELGHGRWRGNEGFAHGSWRGSGFRNEYQAFFCVGKRYRVPGVLATALQKSVAKGFIANRDQSQPRVLWCIKVDGRGVNDPQHRVKHASLVRKSLVCNAVVLGTGTYEPMESEFLYAAYSAFEVEAVKWAAPDPSTGKYKIGVYHQVVIRAAKDNKDDTQWPENLPLAPWY